MHVGCFVAGDAVTRARSPRPGFGSRIRKTEGLEPKADWLTSTFPPAPPAHLPQTFKTQSLGQLQAQRETKRRQQDNFTAALQS